MKQFLYSIKTYYLYVIKQFFLENYSQFPIIKIIKLSFLYLLNNTYKYPFFNYVIYTKKMLVKKYLHTLLTSDG